MSALAEKLPETASVLQAGVGDGLHQGAQLYVSMASEPLVDVAVGENSPGEALTTDHLMLWFSSSKPVAAVAFARLWERGDLDLDDRVADHVPEFAGGGKDAITLRHVLTHTGGFRMLELGWPKASWEEIVAKICARRIEPRWVPGEKAGYHLASSWFILAEVIRRLDGRPFHRHVREEVFEPLGMEDSWIGMPAEKFRAYGDRIAKMWGTEAGEPNLLSGNQEDRVVRPMPGGNGRGPMRDLGRFYEGLGELLTPQTLAAMTAAQRAGMYDHTFKHVLDWGLGFIPNSNHHGTDTVPYGYGPHASRRAFGHSGYRSSTAFRDPEHDLVVALAFNGTPSNEAHETRIRQTLGALYLDLGLAPRP